MGNPEESKTIHVVHCRECDGYHRFNIKTTIVGHFPAELIPDDFASTLFRRELECPMTHKTFVPAEDDWLHLTEQEFQDFVKRK